VLELGKASLGDKTMVDALVPFAEALSSRAAQGTPTAQAWRYALTEAETAAQATAELVPRIGRARPLAERSLGTPDPGAVSLVMVLGSCAETLFPVEAP
ncbi:MAG: DAK2 domain-containing protein, partial [Sciscionella sp.]